MADGDEQGRTVLVTAPRRSVGKRVLELRRNRGWSVEDLAAACSRIGAPELGASVIANIESGRRTYVDVGEWLALSYALDVSPLHVLVPPNPDFTADEQWISVTSERWFRPGWLRQWVRDRWAPSDVDPRIFYSEVPKEEWDPPQTTPEQIDEHSDRLRLHRDIVARFLPHRAPEEAAEAIRDARKAETRIAEDGQLAETPRRRPSSSSGREIEVRPGPDGGWRVTKPNAARVSAKTRTQEEAVRRAIELVSKRGSGRVVQYGPDGEVQLTRDVEGAT